MARSDCLWRGAGCGTRRIAVVPQETRLAFDYSVLDVARSIGVQLPAGTALTRLSVTQLAPIMPYMLMVAMLIFRPRGLMGARET